MLLVHVNIHAHKDTEQAPHLLIMLAGTFHHSNACALSSSDDCHVFRNTVAPNARMPVGMFPFCFTAVHVRC